MVRFINSFKLLLIVGFLLSATSCTSTKNSSTASTTGEYIDDSIITTKVKAAVFEEETLRASQINVKTYRGLVQLSGFIDSQEEMVKAGRVAANVEGVRNVKNDLIVKK